MLGHDKYGRGQQSAFQRARSVCVQKGERDLKRLNKLRAFGLYAHQHMRNCDIKDEG